MYSFIIHVTHHAILVLEIRFINAFLVHQLEHLIKYKLVINVVIAIPDTMIFQEHLNALLAIILAQLVVVVLIKIAKLVMQIGSSLVEHVLVLQIIMI